MPDIDTLASRIDAEFAGLQDKFKKAQADQLREHQQREQRLEKLNRVFDQLRAVWKPRLDVLVAKFGDKVQVTPRLTPSTREAAFDVKSSLAHVTLRFSAVTDRDVTKVILNYDLRIIPILMAFENHAEVEFPLDAVDPDAIGRWIDDRIVGFVKTYLTLHENEFYLAEVMVEDPIAKVRFPKFAAGATLEHQGKTVYFLGEETRQEFAKQHNLAAK